MAPVRDIVPAPRRLSCSRPLRAVPAVLGYVCFDAEHNAGSLGVRLHRQQHALPLLLAQPARFEQRQRGAAAFARHGTRPEVGDCRLGDPARVARVVEVVVVEFGVERVNLRDAILVNLQELRGWPARSRLIGVKRLTFGVGGVVRRQLRSRFCQHPPAPSADMPRQVGFEQRIVGGEVFQLDFAAVAVPQTLEGCPQPVALVPLGFQEGLHEVAVRHRELGQRPRLSRQFLGVFERALQDEPRHRVDVHGGDLAAEAHGFKRDGAAAGERVQHLGRASAVGFADLVAEPLERIAVLSPPVEDAALGYLFRLLNDSAVQALAFRLLDDGASHAFQR